MSNDYLHGLREFELGAARDDFPSPIKDGRRVRVLDLGAGTGWQARQMSESGYDVIAVDLPSSAYARERVFEVQDYDGHTLPVPTRQVDVLFSSNVLEHVPVLAPLLAETRRVLATDGVAIHILPTSAWRTWTALTHFPWVIKRALQTMLGRRGRGAAGVGRGECSAVDRLFGIWPRRHGERGNVLSETWYFSETWWRREFEAAGFEVVETRPAGIFYTGSILMGARLGIHARRGLSRWFGSSCRIYVLRPRGQEPEKDQSSDMGAEA